MTADVLQLHKSVPASDVVGTLRRIADEIEAGDIEWPVTTAVVILGHTDSESADGDTRYQSSHWTTFGAGPRTDTFTIRGLLASVIHDDWGNN